MSKTPLLPRVAQALAVLAAAVASVATSPSSTTPLADGDGGHTPTGVVVLTQGSPSSTVDVTLTGLDSQSPVLTVSPADPVDLSLTPNGAPFPLGFVTATLLTPNGGSPSGNTLDLEAAQVGSGTAFTIPNADSIGRGCLCATTTTCSDQSTDAGAVADASNTSDAGADDASTDDGGAATSTDAGVPSADAGCVTAIPSSCDTCNARVRLTFVLPSDFSSLNVGYNLSVTRGTVVAK